MDGMDQETRAPIVEIAPVTRAGMRLLTLLFGLSETGKTLSALKLAAGIEPNPAKRGLLDTEGGQRGRAYVDHIEGGYLYASLTPPFTPERYVEALLAFERAGVTVLVTDSVSHAWFAEGGVLDMVENAPERNDMAKWAKPKRRLGKMQRRWLSSDVHMILCARAKQPLIESEVGGRKVLTPGPVIPVFEKSLRYDMTIIAQMLGDGTFTVDKPAGKCPGILRPIFAANTVMNEEMGRALAEWVRAEGGKSPAQRALERDAMEAAEGGKDALQRFWGGLTREKRALIVDGMANLKSVALAADEEAERNRDQRSGQQPGDRLGDNPFPDDGPAAGEPITIERAASAAAADTFWTGETLAIPVALKAGMKNAKDWQGWQGEIMARIAQAADTESLASLQSDNRASIEHLKIAVPPAGGVVAQAFVDRAAALGGGA